MTGVAGSDTMYKGFRTNEFWDLYVGYADTIYLKSTNSLTTISMQKLAIVPTGRRRAGFSESRLTIAQSFKV